MLRVVTVWIRYKLYVLTVRVGRQIGDETAISIWSSKPPGKGLPSLPALDSTNRAVIVLQICGTGSLNQDTMTL